jgi:hypothetical protein
LGESRVFLLLNYCLKNGRKKPDKQARIILSRIRTAAREESRLVVSDQVIRPSSAGTEPGTENIIVEDSASENPQPVPSPLLANLGDSGPFFMDLQVKR